MKRQKWDMGKSGIRAQFLGFTGFLVVFPLCLGLLVLNIYLQNTLAEQQKSHDLSTMTQIKNNMDNVLETVNYTTSMLMTNEEFLKDMRILFDGEEGSYACFRAQKGILNQLQNLESASLNAVGVNMAVLTERDVIISAIYRSKAKVMYQGEEWYQKILDNKRKVTLSKGIEQFFAELLMYQAISAEEKAIYIGRQITDYKGRHLGILLCRISIENIWGEFAKNLQEDCALYLYNSDGELQITYNVEEEDKAVHSVEEWKTLAVSSIQMYEEGDSFYIPVKLGETDNLLLYRVPQKAFKEANSEIAKMITTLIILLISLTVITTIWLSGKLSGSLKYVVEQIENAEDGILVIEEPKKNSYQEIHILINSYNQAGERIQALIEKVRIESEQKEKNRYEMLMSQISPHFMFNTVNSIRIMAAERQDFPTASALEALGNILRAVYSSENGMTTVGQEAAMLQSYVEIMKMRFGETFQYIDGIPTELYYYEIPAFTLQPIVENAILHGVHGMDAGQIVVSAMDYPEDMVISIFNNGQVPDKKKIEYLLDHPREKRRSFTGIGLSNVNLRLKMLYGDTYGLIIRDDIVVGFELWIRIPKRTAHKKGAGSLEKQF